MLLEQNVIPDSDAAMALPKIIAEFKGKGYMKIAHQQARLDGGYATQGFSDAETGPQVRLERGLLAGGDSFKNRSGPYTRRR